MSDKKEGALGATTDAIEGGVKILFGLLRHVLSTSSKLTKRVSRGRLDLLIDPNLTFAVADVHGGFGIRLHLEQRTVADAQPQDGPKLVVMLGDYVDRGLDSPGVLAHNRRPPPEGFCRVCLANNHEQNLTDVLEVRVCLDEWLGFGGEATVPSYGIDLHYVRGKQGFGKPQTVRELRQAMPGSHGSFLDVLHIAIAAPQFFFLHTYARPVFALNAQVEHDLIWIRTPFNYPSCPPFSKTVVHGHSPAAPPAPAATPDRHRHRSLYRRGAQRCASSLRPANVPIGWLS